MKTWYPDEYENVFAQAGHGKDSRRKHENAGELGKSRKDPKGKKRSHE